jgi:putative peptidoglycan lipid II flippase
MNHIARSTLIIAVFFGIDKILGFTRQLIVARQFSLSYDLDVFNAANNAPDLLSALISGGALGVALIPVLSENLEQRGRRAAWDIFSRIINLGFIVTAVISILIAIFAPWLITNVIAPGFPVEQKALTVELMRLDLMAILIFSISGLVMAGLQANQHFLLPAMAPGLYNIGQIFGAGILAPQTGYQIGPITLPAFGFGIHGLVYGVIIGAALHLAIQVPGLLKYEFKWVPKIDLRHPEVIKVLKLLGPRVATMFFIQMFFIVRDNLASGLGEGSVTALNLGWFIMQVPETLLGTAIAIAILPTLSEIFSRGDRPEFSKTVNTAVRILLALTIPSALLMAVGVRPLVTAAFAFDAAGTDMVVFAARAYLIGLAGHALLEISARSFYAQQNAIIPLFAAGFNAALYLLIANLLSRQWGYIGIAIANSIAFTTEAFILLWLLNRRFPGLLHIGSTLKRIIPGTLLAGGGLYLLMTSVPGSPLIISLVGMAAGMVVMLPFILPEIKLLLRMNPQRASLGRTP